jgi:hypothetical protein
VIARAPQLMGAVVQQVQRVVQDKPGAAVGAVLAVLGLLVVSSSPTSAGDSEEGPADPRAVQGKSGSAVDAGASRAGIADAPASTQAGGGVKILYRPPSLLVSVLGGILAGAVFKKVWAVVSGSRSTWPISVPTTKPMVRWAG